MKKIAKISALTLIIMFATFFVNVDAKVMDAGSILDITATESSGKMIPADVYVLGNYVFYNVYTTSDVLMAMNDYMLNTPVSEQQSLKLLALSAAPYNVGAQPDVKIENALDAEDEIDEEGVILNVKKIYNLPDAAEVADNANESEGADIANTQNEGGKTIVVFTDSYYVSFVYFNEETDEPEYITILKDEGSVLTADEIPENPYENDNYDFLGWFTFDEETQEDVEVTAGYEITGPLEVYGYREGKRIDVTYHANGGQFYDEYEVDEETYNEYEADPDNSEYDECSVYLYNDETSYSCYILVDEIVVEEQYDSFYRGAFVNNSGYTFDQWYADEELTIPRDDQVTDLTLTDFYAGWIANDETYYTISHRYMALDGENYEEDQDWDTGTTGELTNAVAIPREGFDTPDEIEQQEIKGDGTTVVIIEYPRSTYNVTFEVQGEVYGDVVPVKYEDVVARPEEDPEVEGYAFIGWTLDGEAYDFDTPVTEEITLVAEFNDDLHTISYVINPEEIEDLDALVEPKSTKVKNGTAYGTAAASPVVIPEGYTFNGWYLDEAFTERVETTTIVKLSANAILYASWSPNPYQVTLDDGIDTTENEVIEALYHVEMPAITPPEKEGYTFVGYFNGGNGSGTKYYDENGNNVNVWDQTGSTIIYAYYTANEYTVSYSFAGTGLENPTYTTPVTFDSAYGELADPTEELANSGYDFIGWYLEPTWETLVDAETLVTTAGNHTLYAKYSLKEYTITYHNKANSELELEDSYKVKYTKEDAFTFVSPVIEGYNFLGWYTNRDYTTKLDGVVAGTSGDIEVYARWEAPVTTAEELATALAFDGDIEITLGADITKADYQVIDQDKYIVLDLNGYDLATNFRVFGSLTVKDGSEGKTGTLSDNFTGHPTNALIEADGTYAAEGNKNGLFTLESGTLISKGYGIYGLHEGTIIINGGSVNAYWSAVTSNNTTGDIYVTINDGELSTEVGHTIYYPGQYTLFINGGIINNGVQARMGHIEITGGTFYAPSDSVYDFDTIPVEYKTSGNVWYPDTISLITGTYTYTSGTTETNALVLDISGATIYSTNGAKGGHAIGVLNLGLVEQSISINIEDTDFIIDGTNEQLTMDDVYHVVKYEDFIDQVAPAKVDPTYNTYENVINNTFDTDSINISKNN